MREDPPGSRFLTDFRTRYQDVDSPETLDGFIYHLMHMALIGDNQRQREVWWTRICLYYSTELSDRLFKPLMSVTHDCETEPLFGQR